MISSRNEAELETALDKLLEGTDRKGKAVVADLSIREDTERLGRQAIEAMGRVDILVNNAGTNIISTIEDLKDPDWDYLMALNLTAPVVLSRALIPRMKVRRWGRIVHISSIMGLVSLPSRGAYTVTKTGLIGLTRTMAMELGPWQITVNAIAPGPFSTELTDRMVVPELREYLTNMLVLDRWGRPEDLVGPLLLLASDAGGYITGVTLPVDGGFLTR